MPAKPVVTATRPGGEEPTAVDVEVLPPERAGGRGSPAAGALNDFLPRLIALWLDNLIKVPGLKRRVGLNPFLDFLPGFGEAGDALATVVSSGIILEGARRGLPRIVLTRMAGNVLLNGLVGTIPFVGGAFAFWFRASHRNFGLLQRHTPDALAVAGQRGVLGAKADWLFVGALLVGMLAAVGLCIALALYVSITLLKHLI